MTKARKAVLNVLSTATNPLSAKDVQSILGDFCNQVTIYRTLHYLEEQGLAESFVLHCTAHGTERYYYILERDQQNAPIHHHWFHCTSCHRFIDLGNCPIDAMLTTYCKNHGFKIQDHMLSLVGLCKQCLDHTHAQPL